MRPGRSTPFILAVTAALVVCGAGGIRAQEIGVRAYLTPATPVPPGGAFVLSIEISGASFVDFNPTLPNMSAFARYVGSQASTSTQMVGGQTTVAHTLQYRFQALQEGTFSIGAIEVSVAGIILATEPLQVTVSADPGPSQGQGTGPDSISAEDLFVTAETSRSSVRVGEPFTVEYRIWTRVDVTSYNLTSTPELEGFWIEDVAQSTQPQVEQLVRDGQQYASAIIRRVVLVPTGAGTRQLEPLGLEAQVRVRRRGGDPVEDLFGRSRLFGSTVVPTPVLSNPLTVEVRSLPPGRPEDFSGVVGTLAISADLDRDTVDANDAVTLTVRVAGTGNLRAVPAPVLDLPSDFEVFPPEVTEVVRPSGSGLSGSKTFEYVMIPRAPGARTIPAVSMSFFDADAGGYRTVSTGDVQLMVTGVVAEGPGIAARGGVAQFREDIRFIRLGSSGLRVRDGLLFGEAAFWMFVLLPMLGVAGALGLRRHRDRLEGDVAWARGRRAGRVAKKRLAEARRLADGDDGRAFYAELARALRGFVADKLNVAEAGMQTGDIRAGLGSHGVPNWIVQEILDCLDHCDRQRFAPEQADARERARFLERVSGTMTSLHREIR